MWRNRDRCSTLVPAGRVSLGDKVWWLHTYWLGGHPTSYHRIGLVEVKRGNMCVVRDRYGHTAEVKMNDLLIPET